MIELTCKQWAAVELLARHMTSKEIARELGISPHTVDQRIDTVRRILGVASRRELARTLWLSARPSSERAGAASPVGAQQLLR